jgi:hypothetical protein
MNIWNPKSHSSEIAGLLQTHYANLKMTRIRKKEEIASDQPT